MKKVKYLFPVLFLLFYGCGNSNTTLSGDSQTQDKEAIVDVLYDISMEEIFVKDTNCRSELKDCSHILISFPVFNDIKYSRANLKINHLIADLVGYGDAESNSIVDIGLAANNIIKDYNSFKTDFPESSQIWHFRLKSGITFQDKEKISILFLSESFMGGAHGSLNQIYLNFDSNGNILKGEDLIDNLDLFKSIAEKKFRIKKNIKEGETYSSVGFNFPNDKFRLAAHIGMSDNAYIIHYNSYEIAPYASGPTQLEIRFDELK